MSTNSIEPEVFARLGKIALIGGGKMGEAIVAGLVHGALLDPTALEVAEPGEERRAFLTQAYGVSCVADAALISGAQTVLFAVKPQVFKQVAANVAASLAAADACKPQRVISIAAGITTASIQGFFPGVSVIRVMPNAPLMVSTGMSAVAVAQGTSRAEGELAVELFSLMGEALLVEEAQINAVTAISGSGPAYFALFVEELTRAGVLMGLAEQEAERLSLQTLLGTARQLHLSQITPAELRAAVTSPGGTTQAALESFASSGFGAMVERAVRAALARAEELA